MNTLKGTVWCKMWQKWPVSCWFRKKRELPRKIGKSDFSKKNWFRLVSASPGEIAMSPEYVFSWPVYLPLRRGCICSRYPAVWRGFVWVIWRARRKEELRVHTTADGCWWQQGFWWLLSLFTSLPSVRLSSPPQAPVACLVHPETFHPGQCHLPPALSTKAPSFHLDFHLHRLSNHHPCLSFHSYFPSVCNLNLLYIWMCNGNIDEDDGDNDV